MKSNKAPSTVGGEKERNWIMNNLVNNNALQNKTIPSHSFHPNASLRTHRFGYVAGIEHKG